MAKVTIAGSNVNVAALAGSNLNTVAIGSAITAAAPAPPSYNPNAVPWVSHWWAEGDAFTALSLADGADVAAWPDEDANQADLAQAVEANRPHYRSSFAALNDKPAVEFGDNVNMGLSLQVSGTFTYPMSWVFVCSVDSTGNNTLMDGTANLWRNLVRPTATTRPQLFAGSFPGVMGSNDTELGAHLVVAYFDGGSGADTMYIDETLEISGNAGSGRISDTRRLRLGIDESDAFAHDGGIAFFGAYEGDVRADDAWSGFTTWVEDYYGITLA